MSKPWGVWTLQFYKMFTVSDYFQFQGSKHKFSNTSRKDPFKAIFIS